MKHAQKPNHVSLSSLLGWIREGRFVIPDFQREFEWRPSDIRELLRSIFQDYFIGSLLLWRGTPTNFEALSSEPIYASEGGTPWHIVLDGQQRLTAMHYAFHAPNVPPPNRSNRFVFCILVDRFMREEFDDAFTQDWGANWCNSILTDKDLQFRTHRFPIATIGKGGFELYDWIRGYEDYWKTARENGDPEAQEHASNAQPFGTYIKELVEQYQISYVELESDIPLPKVCDIFTQINSRGVRLDVFDLVNALLKPKGVQLKHLFRDAQSRLSFAQAERMNVYVLQVMSILLQDYCSPPYLYYLLPGERRTLRDADGSLRREVLISTTEEFTRRWDNAVAALEQALELLRHPQEFGVTSASYLPYASILPAFAALLTHISTLPAPKRLQARRKLNHWYWAAIFTNRYSGSVDSRSTRDFLDVKAWIEDETAIPTVVKDFNERFRSLDLRGETRSNASIYRAIFNLFVIGGARDWVTGAIPQAKELDDHHIVPASWGAANGLKGLIDSILNRAPLTANTNRHVISDRLPNSYLPELIQECGEAAVRSNLESHFISPAAFDILLRDPFTPADYEAFLNERHRTILEAIENLLVKERLDLSPTLREMDRSIEDIELRLRDLIEQKLTAAGAEVPHHIQPLIADRIKRDVRKGTIDEAKAATLAGQLEYFDLRELQDTISAKPTWPIFEDTFPTKEALAAKFDQLAGVRNGIRHSRTVTRVVQKEGEAAILWFEERLPKRTDSSTPPPPSEALDPEEQLAVE